METFVAMVDGKPAVIFRDENLPQARISAYGHLLEADVRPGSIACRSASNKEHLLWMEERAAAAAKNLKFPNGAAFYVLYLVPTRQGMDAAIEAKCEEDLIAEILPRYRDDLLKRGVAKGDVEGAIRRLWTEPEFEVLTLDDYNRAAARHEEMRKTIPEGDKNSREFAKMFALGGEMARFEEEYMQAYGRLP